MPWLPIYDIITILLIIIPFGLLFLFSSFLYNKLCQKSLLTSKEIPCKAIEHKISYFMIFILGIITASAFYILISHNNFDFSLPFLIPPIIVAIICETKNGFIPFISTVIFGLCVFLRLSYYAFFWGADYAFSIILSFCIAFVLTFIPKIVFSNNITEKNQFSECIIVSFFASYFSPIFSLVFTGIVYLILSVGYELPNLISRKKTGVYLFKFKIPVLIISAAVFFTMILL